MNAKEAVNSARKVFSDLFANDRINDIGLEEVRFDNDVGIWSITIGYYRDADMGAFRRVIGEPTSPDVRRYYRTVRLNDETGEMVSVSIREIAA